MQSHQHLEPAVRQPDLCLEPAAEGALQVRRRLQQPAESAHEIVVGHTGIIVDGTDVDVSSNQP
jgi:hypothetical protein